MTSGRRNIAAGLFFLAGFMLYGFVLIYLRDFAPGKEEWIAGSLTGKHFESRLAHVHGNLFAFLNVVIGYLLIALPLRERSARLVSWLALAGMLMPVGILTEVLFGVPPLLVLVGGVSMLAAMVVLGFAVLRAPHSGAGVAKSTGDRR